jgi:hypothetical protein
MRGAAAQLAPPSSMPAAGPPVSCEGSVRIRPAALPSLPPPQVGLSQLAGLSPLPAPTRRAVPTSRSNSPGCPDFPLQLAVRRPAAAVCWSGRLELRRRVEAGSRGLPGRTWGWTLPAGAEFAGTCWNTGGYRRQSAVASDEGTAMQWIRLDIRRRPRAVPSRKPPGAYFHNKGISWASSWSRWALRASIRRSISGRSEAGSAVETRCCRSSRSAAILSCSASSAAIVGARSA